MMDVTEKGITFTIKKVNNYLAFGIAFLVAVILFFTDIITGKEISFSIFYLLPITISIFLSGKNMGLVFSTICALLWFIADIFAGAKYSILFIPIWNTIMRFGYFLFHTLLLDKFIRLVSEVREAGFRDPLTKAFNWRYFEEYTNNIIKNISRKRSKIALAYFDIDNFKRLNDTLGHNIGDQALIAISDIVRNEIRSGDIFARLGGDEFAMVLQEVDINVVQEILNRIHRKINDETKQMKWDISLSIGCIVFSSLTSTIGPMLKQVDDLMYEVKKNGKNNVKIVNQYENQA